MPRTRTQWLQTLLIVVVLLPLLAHMFNGQFTRMMADDYCFTNDTLQRGWWGAMVYEYTQWSGTFSSTALQNVIALIGTSAVRWLPMVMLVIWLAGVIWTVYEVGILTGIGSPRFVALFIGIVIVFATVDGASNIFQSLYWTAGSTKYITPLALMSLYAGYTLHLLRRPPWGLKLVLALFVSVILPFAVGGLSPLGAPLQVVLLATAMMLVWRLAPPQAKRPMLILLGIALVTGTIGMILQVAAPGNAIRQAQFQPHPSLPMVVVITLWATASFVSTSALLFSPMGVVIALIIPGLMAYTLQPLDSKVQFFIKKHSLRLLLLSGVIGLGLLMVCFVITAYSISDIPPARAMIEPQFILVLLALTWGVIMGLGLQKGTARLVRLPLAASAGLAILLVLGPIRSTLNTLRQMPDFAAFARDWDARDSQIRAAVKTGTTEIIVAPFRIDLATYAGLKKLESDSNARGCAANFYGLKTLSVMPRHLYSVWASRQPENIYTVILTYY